MIIIPAVDILDGRCVRLIQGDYNQVTEYHTDPVEMALGWESQGAQRLHVVDLDGAREGRAVNRDLVIKIAETLSIPVEVGGGIRTSDTIEDYLNHQVDRIILGTVAYRQPGLVSATAGKYPGRIWVGIDGRNGKVAVEGWREATELDVYELAAACQEKGAGGIIFTDIARDGVLTGPNLDSLRQMAATIDIPLIASGGISQLVDLEALEGLGLANLEGCIVGKALYAEQFTLQDAIATTQH